jgi:hypothetical protein
MTHPLSDITERERKFVHEHRVGAGFLDRGKIVASDVLHQREDERLAVVAVSHERGDRREACSAGRAPAALAGDELVATALGRPDDDRLHDSLSADGVREAADPVRVDVLPGLPRVRADRAERDLQELGRGGAASDEDLEPSA